MNTRKLATVGLALVLSLAACSSQGGASDAPVMADSDVAAAASDEAAVVDEAPAEESQPEAALAATSGHTIEDYQEGTASVCELMDATVATEILGEIPAIAGWNGATNYCRAETATYILDIEVSTGDWVVETMQRFAPAFDHLESPCPGFPDAVYGGNIHRAGAWCQTDQGNIMVQAMTRGVGDEEIPLTETQYEGVGGLMAYVLPSLS